MSVLMARDAVVSDAGDAVQRDPEVRQARMIAEAARSRLLACVASPEDVIDLAEAQRMLDAIRNAQAHAGDAEDRVLVHCGLLTPAEAGRRAALRRPASQQLAPVATTRTDSRRQAARVVASVLAPVAAGVVSAALARRFRCGCSLDAGVRLPPARP